MRIPRLFLASTAAFVSVFFSSAVLADTPERRCETSPRIGFVGIPRRYVASEAEWRRILDAGREARLDLLSVGYGAWRDIEATRGVFQWRDLDPLLCLIDGTGVRLALDLPTPITLDGEAADLPADLRFTSFSDPVLMARYKALVGAAIATFGARLDYVSFHTENSEAFVAAHPEERGAFCAFLAAAAAHGRSLDPTLKFSAYTTPRHPDDLARCMARGMDMMGVAAVAEFPGGALDDLDDAVARLSRLADGRKLAILETGWPSSRALGTSKAEQALFVKRMLRLLKERRKEIEFASLYTVFDEDREIARQWIAGAFPIPPWTEAQRRSVLDWVTSLGLKTIDLKPKPAWRALVTRLRETCAGESAQ